MDYPRQTQQPPLHSSVSFGSLSRISNVSDFADLDNLQHIQPRPSLVSLQTDDGGRARSGSEDEGRIYANAPSGWSSFTGYAGSGGYEPVPLVGGGDSTSPPRKQSRPFINTASVRRHHEAILEEEDGIDLGLINSAAPIGVDDHPSSPIGHDSLSAAFDLTSVLGPTTKADEAFMKKLQEREAQGKLTGGLGLGIQTQARLTESALLASSPIVEKSPLGRSFSRAPRPGLNRGNTLRQIGQHEANKRGEVIEVVMDSDLPSRSEVDLSIMAGPDTMLSSANPSAMRRATFLPSKGDKTQIFYPQPDWKPFSMRWPYLLTLILLSIVLAGAQEVLYQMSTREPLVKFREPSEIPGAAYFGFKFLPMIIAVSYGVLWQITDFEVKRLEAFYQMSKEGGALAAESINVDYITHFNLFRPIRALQYRHYAVALSTVASLLANALVPTLSAASIILTPDRATRMKFPNDEKRILIHSVWSRFLTVVFVIIALLGSILFYQLQKRRSGLLADVKGIAGLASMAVVSHILMDFKDMDVATHKDIHHKLKNHRYVLRNSALAPDEDNVSHKYARAADKYTKNHLSENPQPLMFRAAGVIPFVTGIVIFLALIPMFLFTPADALTDKAPWVVTALAVCTKLSWGGLETDVRMMEPYYILSRRHAPPKTLTLDYTAMPFGWVAFQGAVNGHWLVFAAGFGSVLAEVLTIVVTSLATVEGRVFLALIHGGGHPEDHDHGAEENRDINAGQETPLSFWISLAMAMVILLYMGVVATVVFVRRRRVFLPRQPNTIASVLAYIHQSKMLYDFVGTSKLTNPAMVRKLEDVGKVYGLGWFQGRDGQSHCGVDEEELLSGYKFGYDYSRATKPWEEEQVNWL
ncbi:hypothetical protein B0H67DRAFT_643000 [Lasiosphaeris hirsuta]|uniref:Uncharacterized protein n=1 Tax=Lasiosphaeris hirsuta TaxID=260670 RepID=A0AA40APM4_9PEZI|nr:hypothetical protein B0H67DRAFT_643000 [Lasiosphaeris hirsuta]